MLRRDPLAACLHLCRGSTPPHRGLLISKFTSAKLVPGSSLRRPGMDFSSSRESHQISSCHSSFSSKLSPVPGRILGEVQILHSLSNRFVCPSRITSTMVCSYMCTNVMCTRVCVQMYGNQGFNRYMPNARNGINPSMVPQGLMGPMMPLPLDASSPTSGASLDGPISLPLPRPTLASALASATPENQRMVSPFPTPPYPILPFSSH